MSITYFYRDTSSDLSGSPSEIGNFDLLRETGTASSQINTGNMAASATRSCWFFTEAADPGTDGTSTGEFTLELRIDIENANVGIRCHLQRYSGGVAQGSEIEAAEGSQTAGAATRQYNWTDPNLGTWGAGDRLGVRVQFTNISGLMNQSCRLGANLSSDTLITPFTAGATVVEGEGEGAYSYSGSATGEVTHVGAAAGAYTYGGAAAGTASGGGSTFLSETFTAANDTFITALDANWEEMPWDMSGGTTANRPLVLNNQYRPHTANEPCRTLRWNVDPGADEYDVTAVWTFQALQLSRQLAIFVRMTPSGSTAHGDMSYYRISCHGSTSPAFFINRVVGGSSTQVATESVSLTAGTPIDVRVEVRSTGIEVYVDDTLLLSTDDTTITQRGRVGIGGHRGDGTGTTPLADNVIGTSGAPSNDVQGSAAGAYDYSGTASGEAAATGTASGGYTYAGAAAGETTVAGSASGEYAYGGTAAGTGEGAAVEGLATGAYAYAGTAAAPAAGPSGLIAIPVSASRIDLEWDAYDGALGYSIEVDDVVIDQDVQATTYSVTDLEPDTEYKFRVGAEVGA